MTRPIPARSLQAASRDEKRAVFVFLRFAFLLFGRARSQFCGESAQTWLGERGAGRFRAIFFRLPFVQTVSRLSKPFPVYPNRFPFAQTVSRSPRAGTLLLCDSILLEIINVGITQHNFMVCKLVQKNKIH